jgi:flagellar biosynthesis protein FlhF
MKGIKMPTITVTAPDSAMAMDEVVRQLGSDAYILSTTQQDGLVQIKASLDPLNTLASSPKSHSNCI